MSPRTIVTLTCGGCGKTYSAGTFHDARLQLDCHLPCRVAVAREINTEGAAAAARTEPEQTAAPSADKEI